MIQRLQRKSPLLLPVYAPTLLLAFGNGMLIPIMPLYAQSFRSSYGLVGLVLASQGFGALLGDAPAGLLIGRLGLRRSMTIGVGVIALSMFAMSGARSMVELVAYGLLSGLGTALWSVARHTYLTVGVSNQQRGGAIALFGGIFRIGVFAGPYAGGVLGAAFGLRAPFIVYSVLGLTALLLPAFFANQALPAQLPRKRGINGKIGQMAALWRRESRTFSTAGVGLFLAALIRGGRRVIIPLYAANIIGLDVQQIGLILSISSFLDMLMFYPAGVIMDNVGRKFAYVPSFLLQGVGMALVPFTGGFGSLLAAMLVAGFGNGLGSGTMMTLGADLAPADAMGEFLGLWRLIGDSGRTSAPAIVGGVAELVGLIPAAFVIAGVGLLASAVFAFTVPETLVKRERGSPTQEPS